MQTTTLAAAAPMPAPMSVFERYLTVWVLLCIVVGIALGQGLLRVSPSRPGAPAAIRP